MLLKNSIHKLTIESVTGDGQGISHVDGQVVFVPYGAVGDEVEVLIIKTTKTYAVGKILNVLTASFCRIDVDCKAFLKCGGCAFRHITLEEELRIKTQSVKDAMERIGGINVKVDDCVSTPVITYRNKAQLPVTQTDKGVVCGFYASHSHRIVENTLDCLNTPEIFSLIAKDTVSFMEENKIDAYIEESGKGVVRHLYMRENKKGDVMLCLVVNSDVLKSEKTELKYVNFIVEKYPEIKSVYLNVNKKQTNAVLGEEFKLLFGDNCFEDEILSVRLSMSPDSFFQVNRVGAETVYKTAFSLLPEKSFENVYDLYCGVGSIGLSLFSEIKNGNLNINAERLFGIEIVKDAVKWAKHNAKKNGIDNAQFFASDSADITEMALFEKYPPSLVILDPPRKGVEEKLLKYLADKGVNDILYISCNPATLARDMSYLYSRGYTSERVVPVNMFSRTGHVECVVHLHIC